MCIIQDIKKLQLRRQLCLRRPRYVSFLPSWANVWPPDASAHMQVSVQTEQLPCLPSTTKLECSAWLKCNMEDISPSGVLTYMIGAQKGVPCHIHPFFHVHTYFNKTKHTHTHMDSESEHRGAGFHHEEKQGKYSNLLQSTNCRPCGKRGAWFLFVFQFGNFLHYKTESKSSENELWFLAPPLTGASGKV